jgi:HK97 family phage portal protein
VRLGVGQHVRDEDRALQISAVWACVHLIAETIGALRVMLQRAAGDEEGVWIDAPRDEHPLALLLDDETRRLIVEHIAAYLALHGQAFVLPRRVGTRVQSIEVLPPALVRVRAEDGEKVIDVQTDSGAWETRDDVVHLRRIGDPRISWSPLEFGALALGIAAGAERATSSVYASGGKRSGVLMSDRVLTPQLRDQLRASFQALADGSDGRLLVLEGGLRYEPIAMTPQDIELLAARRYQVAEVCRYFGVPPELIYAETETPAAALREIWRHWVQTTVLSYVQRIESGLQLCMWPAQRTRFRVRFAMQSLLRADDRERMEAWRIAINAGVMTPNEVRLREGLPPLPGGDRLMIQGATVPLDAE